MARFVEDRRDASLFVLGSLESLVPETSPARSIWGCLEGLDFSAFEASYKNDTMGRRAVEPRRLLGVWILGLLRGVTASTRLAELCGRDVEFRWMLGDAAVKKSTLCAFRKDQPEALMDVSAQVLAALSRSGLLPGESLAVDGTVVRAAASCRSAKTRENLTKKVKRLRGVVEEKLEQCDAPGESADVARQRLARLEDALAEMTSMGLTAANDKMTLTEPEATTKKLKTGAYGPAYNAQIAVDAQTGVVVHAEVVDAKNDSGQLKAQVEGAEQTLATIGAGALSTVVADSAYYDRRQLAELEERGVRCFVSNERVANRKPPGVDDAFLAEAFTYDAATDTMTCPAGQTLRWRKLNPDKTSAVYQATKKACTQCPHKPNCCPKAKDGRYVNRTLYPEVDERVVQRLHSEEGKRQRQARSVSAEGVFARFRALLGWTRCRTWGKLGATCELLLNAIANNLCLLTGIWQPLAPKA